MMKLKLTLAVAIMSCLSACASNINNTLIKKENKMKTHKTDKSIFNLEQFPEDNLLVRDAPFGYYAIVSNKISLEGMPIAFMYREQPMDLSFDSGWRVFSGTETQEYADNPDNFSFYSLARLVHYQPNTSGLFWQDIGTVLEMKQGQSHFSPVHD